MRRIVLLLSVIFVTAVYLVFSSAFSNNLASLILLRGVMRPEVDSALVDRTRWVEFLLTPSLLSNDPRVVERAHFALGLVYENNGNHTRAVNEWRLANAAPLWERVSDRAWSSGDSATAILFRQRAIDTSPDRFQNYFTLAWYYWPGLGRVADAIQVYSETAAIAPPASFEHYLAEGYVFQLQGQWALALEKFEQALRVEPGRRDIHRLSALAARQLGAYPLAIEHLKQAVDPAHQQDWTTSWIYVEIGDVHRAAMQYAKASFWYSEAARIQALNPGAHQGHAALGDIYLEQGLFAEAIVEFNAAIVLGPDIKDYYYRLGQSYERNSQSSEAATEYRRVLELDPNDTEARQALERLLNH